MIGGTACTPVLGHAFIRDVSGKLEPRASRASIIQTLGVPRQTRRFDPTVAGTLFAGAPKNVQQARVSIYDEYRLNGLTLTSGYSPYSGSFLETYDFVMIFTLGFAEVIYFPSTIADLSTRSWQRYQLRLWYDPSGRLIGQDHQLEVR